MLFCWKKFRKNKCFAAILFLFVYMCLIFINFGDLNLRHMFFLNVHSSMQKLKGGFKSLDQENSAIKTFMDSYESIWSNYIQLYFETVNFNERVLFHSGIADLWPQAKDPYNDRIWAQMHYIPKTYNVNSTYKYIYMSYASDLPQGPGKFMSDNCAVKKCYIFNRLESGLKPNAYVFKSLWDAQQQSSTPLAEKDVVWIYYQLESPMNTGSIYLGRAINWTATYRWDSTIVAPYEKFLPFGNISYLNQKTKRNFAKNTTQIAVLVVSNCFAGNGRLDFAKELQEYMHVDILGHCGLSPCELGQGCFAHLAKDYLFYLSFENSNCNYYVTEKLFWNALNHDIVPVVFGARKNDYINLAPPGSFIFAEDFPTVASLAAYLQYLANNPKMYNKYFAWKGRGEYIDTKFFCRLCSMLHGLDEVPERRWIKDFSQWWSEGKNCRRTNMHIKGFNSPLDNESASVLKNGSTSAAKKNAEKVETKPASVIKTMVILCVFVVFLFVFAICTQT